MSTLLLPLADIPGVIRESVRDVLKAHGFDIAESGPPITWMEGSPRFLQPILPARLEELLREIGNNAAQALYSIDATPDVEAAAEPDLAAIRGGS